MGVEHFLGTAEKKLWVLHPVNAERRAGDYREIHTTRCGGNLEDGARWLSGALAIERRKQNCLLTTSSSFPIHEALLGLVVGLS